MECRETSMDSLICDELLSEILSKLKDNTNKESTSLVCKRWLKALRDSKMSLGISIPTDDVSSIRFVHSVLAQHPHIVSLTIKSKHQVVTEHLASKVVTSIASWCKTLKELHFTLGPISANSLADLSTGCPNLISLDLLQPLTSSCLPILSQFKSLEDLCIRGHPESVPSADYNNNDQPLPLYGSLHLRKLCLINVRVYNGCDLRWIWNSCPRLQKLELLHCDGVGDSSSMLSSFMRCLSSLHELKLHQCRAIAGKVLELVSEYSLELKALTVYDGADTRGLRLVVQKCRALEVLDLRLPLDLSNEDLREIARRGQWLKSLRLHSCWLATGADMQSIASSITSNLEELVLIKCRAIVHDTGTLSALVQHLPKLKSINLSENEHLADKELVAMLASCEDVRNLFLCKCHRLTDKVIDIISRRCLNLECIDISGCDGLTTKSALGLLNCSKLKNVRIEADKLTPAVKKLASKKGVAFVT